MKYTKHIFYSIIFVSISLILGACGSDDGNVDLSEASSVDEDNVTSEYYDEMVTMVNAFPEYAKKMQLKVVHDSTIRYESKEYLMLINSLDLIPISKVDKELDKYVYDFKIESELAAEYMLEYAESDDLDDKITANEYIDDAVKTFDMIKAIGDKYGLK